MVGRLEGLARIVALGATLLTAILAPAPVGAQPTGRAALFNIEAPTVGSMISNGSRYGISGWTAGSRVDVYLDGPAGVGTGIGSDDVGGNRPDVARAHGAALMRSGFEVTWLPTDLSRGQHRLFVYALIDGVWVLQQLPIIGEGNVLPPPRPPIPDWEGRDPGQK